jgi:hypothetical protein
VTLVVAIASEYDAFDGEVYELLLRLLLGRSVTRWTSGFVFNGYHSVAKQCPAFLAAARAAGVRRALLAIDNDGDGTRCPEHDAAHIPPAFDIRDDEGCRECWLTAAIPSSWRAAPQRSCVVVPIQVVETWLLVLRGDALTPTPEQMFDRKALKRRVFGTPSPPCTTRVRLAREQLDRPGALDVLRALPSSQRFAERIRGW